ncbi:MAG: glycosyltransferase [Alphaproteobacteria bacterium]|nr:glycosyltransferase [Alphaproteobacteria bacterium]
MASEGSRGDLEAAELHFKRGQFDQARACYARCQSDPVAAQRLVFIAQVEALAGSLGELLYPECLIDVLLDECAASTRAWESQPSTLMTVCHSLAAGGAERQTVTVLKRLAADARIAQVFPVFRVLDEPGGSFFLPMLREVPLDPIVFAAQDPNLPQAETNSRLKACMDLLPAQLRRDIRQFAALLRRHRPQAVHIRHEMAGCAIACALENVPRFAIHRGTLPLDRWNQNATQLTRLARPRRHTYQRLLERPGFVMTAPSRACRAADREWLEWLDGTRFRTIPNAVDVQALSAERGRDLRGRLGIAQDAFVLGGVFRLAPVKRPALWMETALLVADALPDARFVLVGDGALFAELERFAHRHGLAARLHMPGAVHDIADWYAIMDLNLLVSEREGFANVLAEGQALGIPALAIDVGGVGEAMEVGVTGRLLADDATAQQIADAVESIADDPAWRDAARRAGPTFVRRKFRADICIQGPARGAGTNVRLADREGFEPSNGY